MKLSVPAAQSDPVAPLLLRGDPELDAGTLNSDWFLSRWALPADAAAAHARIPVRRSSPITGQGTPRATPRLSTSTPSTGAPHEAHSPAGGPVRGGLRRGTGGVRRPSRGRLRPARLLR